MPLTSADYTSLAELKALLDITDVNDDAELGFAITSASRAIDHAANRYFGVDAPAVARVYTYQGDTEWTKGRQVLQVNDLSTTTDLVVKFDEGDDGTYEKTLTLDTDFYLEPKNSATDGRPFTSIVLKSLTFPKAPGGIQVTAKFGWTAVPTTIKQACLIQASRFFKRKDAPFGVAGSPDLGSEVRLLARLDPDVAVMVSAYKRYWGAA